MNSATASSAPRAIDDSDMSQSIEAELVRETLAGSSSAARELVRLFHRPIFNYINRMVGQSQDAEDLTQETFVKAFRSLDRVDTSRPLVNWLFTIARRTALNHFRSRKNFVELPPEAAAEGPGPRQQTERKERVENLWAKARRILNPAEYEALWLRFGEDLTMEEAAHATGRSIPSIKTLIYRARQRMLTAKESLL
ncbi:RNA polymerase sigma factor [Synoicihabitans lomoniglobus]|uniref:Sigma-70 family RNA polymerase sigma factor n=1 Tax=Synoicihabitans lomoniglobus TaxID=2909285 RepID=A0AAF0CPK2_9BACT|nr:sigma-70 family RNA polymerase sigma factor [Opitutaceae bacterium LMO-M01]WED65179.1 sigma-70 family RNA polymerase sigma factor [Opitutaceae bacterium LMO-M01]